MQVKLADIRIGDRYRKDMGDIEGLARSMNEIGLLHPVAIDADYRLIAGERRILAARMLGWERIEAHFVDLDDLLRGEQHENTMRKDFTITEAVAIGEALEPLERAAAKERQRQAGGANPGSVKFTEAPAMDKVAGAVGMSRPTYAKAQEIIQAAEQEPERFGDIVDQMDSSGSVSGAYREFKRRNLPALSVDVKVRSKDYSLRGKDDLALETWSVKGQKVGWTRDTAKRTDYILWFWQDTGRFFIVSFPALCRVFCHHWQKWLGKYEHETQDSGRWQSECVFVPRAVVRRALEQWSGGTIPERSGE